jgi:hypothetical protein
MYGLPQAGIIANQFLVKCLGPFGYYPVTHTPGLWRHKRRPIMFSLVVDNFGVKYVRRKHAQHLVDTLSSFYKITTDWETTKYCGITLKWDYDNQTVDLSMPNCVADALHHFQHDTPNNLYMPPLSGVPPNTVPKSNSLPPLTNPPNIPPRRLNSSNESTASSSTTS